MKTRIKNSSTLQSTAQAVQRSAIPVIGKKEVKHCKEKLNIVLLSHRIFSSGYQEAQKILINIKS